MELAICPLPAAATRELHRTVAERGLIGAMVPAYLPHHNLADRGYDDLYAEYLALHDYFGRGSNEVMHRMKARRRAAHVTHSGEAKDST